LVALGRDAPAEVAVHGVLHQVLPVLLIVIGGVGAAAGVVQLVGAVAREGEAVAVALGGILDGVPQAAGLADDGRGAVAAGHHLGQAAGLALGRHEEAVRTGVDLLG